MIDANGWNDDMSEAPREDEPDRDILGWVPGYGICHLCFMCPDVSHDDDYLRGWAATQLQGYGHTFFMHDGAELQPTRWRPLPPPPISAGG